MYKFLIAILFGSPLMAATQPQPLHPPTVRERANPYVEAALDAGQPFEVISAASAMPNISQVSLAAILGHNLASQTATGTAPYPTTLGGVILPVQDSAGALHVAWAVKNGFRPNASRRFPGRHTA